mmetsp:Transcript_18734/g.34705  ORF Transcript_18734/g.34705 Transcript_18734/m.34705 type:complete len:263 (+) Transcript_18734:535-1323(+)
MASLAAWDSAASRFWRSRISRRERSEAADSADCWAREAAADCCWREAELVAISALRDSRRRASDDFRSLFWEARERAWAQSSEATAVVLLVGVGSSTPAPRSRSPLPVRTMSFSRVLESNSLNSRTCASSASCAETPMTGGAAPKPPMDMFMPYPMLGFGLLFILGLPMLAPPAFAFPPAPLFLISMSKSFCCVLLGSSSSWSWWASSSSSRPQSFIMTLSADFNLAPVKLLMVRVRRSCCCWVSSSTSSRGLESTYEGAGL